MRLVYGSIAVGADVPVHIFHTVILCQAVAEESHAFTVPAPLTTAVEVTLPPIIAT